MDRDHALRRAGPSAPLPPSPAAGRALTPDVAPGGRPPPSPRAADTTGRHRLAQFGGWADWWRWRWRPQCQLVVEVTVAELQRRQEGELAYASRARRVLVVPRQRSTISASR
ncbi:MAG: hypothetical protein JO281_12080 [Pseudonocardiales bacterium]|nr:hypothetical protein [Pseudonocardiales bacterium]